MNKLKLVIHESGLKMNYIAAYLGISRFTLRKRLNGETRFNDFEKQKLSELLNLKGTDFFYNDCRQNHILEKGGHNERTIDKN